MEENVEGGVLCSWSRRGPGPGPNGPLWVVTGCSSAPVMELYRTESTAHTINTCEQLKIKGIVSMSISWI
jgi:hypothetical protein